MCKIIKSVDVHAIQEHLQTIMDELPASGEKVNATLAEDEWYVSMTAVFSDGVLCVNFMKSGKEEAL